MLDALNESPFIVARERLAVKTPKLYFFDHETSIQVLEDVYGGTDLLQLLNTLSLTILPSIGHALGGWLRAFHEWTSAPGQAALQNEVSKNNSMRELKSKITYEMFIPVLEKNFPETIGGYRKVLESVEAALLEELSSSGISNLGEDWGIVHGDFWMGK